jgi:hypothetical integral membrane protein (TIGR02206 family)
MGAHALMLGAGAWLNEFEPRSLTHVIVVAVSAVLIAATVVAGRRLAGGALQRQLEIGIGWSTIWLQLFALVWRNLPGIYDVQEALPLQLCRVVAWACAIGLMTGARWAVSLTFFWGLGLSSMGFVTPVVTTGPGTVGFWLFWAAHVQIVGIAVYQIAVHGYGPRVKDWWFAAAVSCVYVALVVPVNLALGVDYGFLGEGEYDRSTLAGRLGTFPLRAVRIVVMAQVWMLVLFVASRGVGLVKIAALRRSGA